MRSGDEPIHARSPLRLRLALAGFGLVSALVAAAVVAPVAPTAVVILFLAVALLAVVDLVVVCRQIRRGAHFQPGPEVPPYRPVEAERRAVGRWPRRGRSPPTERTRMRRYLILMTACLVLISLAWFWVRFHSMPIAVAMSMVAAVLPPIAVIVANFGVQLPAESPPPRRQPPARQRTSSEGDHSGSAE